MQGLPALARNKNDRLELFVVDPDSSVWHRWQEEPGSDRWKAWDPLGEPGQRLGINGPPAVGQNKDGRLELFVTADDGAIWHRRQDPAAPGGWSGWVKLDRPLDRPGVKFIEVSAVARPNGPLVLVHAGLGR